MGSTWFEVTVVILSVMLGILLVISIVASILIIRIAKSIKRITDHAEQVADNAEHVSDFFRTAAPPMAILKLIATIGDSIYKKSSRKDKK